ncbi:MAG: MFS transporter [Patescibacteria group bacterium]
MNIRANIEESEETSFHKVLHINSFRFLWFGQIASQFAVNTMLFVLALRVYERTGSNAAVSGLFLAYGIPAVLFGMVAGTLVDYFDKKKILVTCDILRAFLVVLLLFTSEHVWVVYLITFLNALITQLYVPAEAPLIPKLVPEHLLLSANSLFSFTFYTSLAVGSIAAGPLLRALGPHIIFALISGMFFLAAYFESRVKTVEVNVGSFSRVMTKSPAMILSRVYGSLVEGISYVRSRDKLREALTLLTGTQIIISILGILGPGFADRVLSLDIHDASVVIMAPVVFGIIAGALWIGSRGEKENSKKLISTGVLSAGVILLLLSLIVFLSYLLRFSDTKTPVYISLLSFVLFFLLGIANSMLDVPANSLLQSESEGVLRGRVYGMLTAAVGGIGILPVVIGGLLADTIGIGKVIFLLGICIVLYGIVRIRYNKIS